jgi:hypothetical protein
MFLFCFTLGTALDSATVIALSDSLCKKNRKMGDSFDFERGQIVGACSAGASVIKTATI